MDKLFKNKDLVERFGEFKKYSAFAKEFREMFVWTDHNIFRVQTFQEILRQWNATKNSYFIYDGKKYSVVLLICLILWEMNYARIGKGNIKYIDENDIMKYVDTIIEEYLP